MKQLDRFKAWSVQDRLVALALAMVVITSFAAAPAGISAPVVVPVVLEGFAFLMLAVALNAATWDFRRDLVKSSLRSGTSIATILFFLIAAISCVYSSNRAVSVQGAIQVGVGVLLYFVVSLNLRHTRHISRLAIVLTLIALGGALYGCFEYSAHPSGQARGLFGDHQLYGSFLMILLPFVAISALTEKDTNRQLAAQTATVVMVISLLLANSRSAWIGAAFGLTTMGLLAAIIPARRKADPDVKRKRLVPGLLMAAGILFFLLDAPISESFLNRAYTLAHVSKENAWIDRQQVWRGAIKMIEDHPVTGLGESMYAYSHYPYTRLGMPIGLFHVRPSLSDQTHNLYLQTAAETGIPGGVALIAILISFWIAGIRRLRGMERSDRRNMLLGSLGATFAFAVDAIASPSWQFGQVMILFWLSLGIGVACIRQTSAAEYRRSANVVSVPIWFRRPAARLGLLVLAALMPVSVIASTRLNGFYPTTIYDSVTGTVDHIDIGVLPDPVSPTQVTEYTPLYTGLAPFVQRRFPAGVPRLPIPTIDAYQSITSGPHYRLQLEVMLRDKSGVYDGGSITLDPNTHWRAVTSGRVGSGALKAEPYKSPRSENAKAWNYGNLGDFMAYIGTDADIGHNVTIVADYAGFKASTNLDFTSEARLAPYTSSQVPSTSESSSGAIETAHRK